MNRVTNLLYPWTRHFQRYEYVVKMGYVTGKTVLDVGAFTGYGAIRLVETAKRVIAIDPDLPPEISTPLPMPYIYSTRLKGIKGDIYGTPAELLEVDVTVVIEVIEHNKDDDMFVKKLAELGEYCFLTTPLAKTTGPTGNEYHFVEYSHEDLVKVVSKEFVVLDVKYQLGNMDIVDEAQPNGSSMDYNHVVQMLWMRRRG